MMLTSGPSTKVLAPTGSPSCPRRPWRSRSQARGAKTRLNSGLATALRSVRLPQEPLSLFSPWAWASATRGVPSLLLVPVYCVGDGLVVAVVDCTRAVLPHHAVVGGERMRWIERYTDRGESGCEVEYARRGGFDLVVFLPGWLARAHCAVAVAATPAAGERKTHTHAHVGRPVDVGRDQRDDGRHLAGLLGQRWPA